MPTPPLVTTYHAASFVERGLAAPFTSNTLAGARMRPTRRAAGAPPPRCPLEAIVPNPSGGRGTYVVPWTDVRGLFRPTVHDLRLGDAAALAAQSAEALRPATIRRIARDVARDGFAGRAAAAAAAEAGTVEAARIAACRGQLLRDLERCLNLPSAIGEDGKAALAPIAARLNRPPAAVAVALQRLAEILAAHGLAPDAPDAPVPSLIADLNQMLREVAVCAQEQPGLVAAGASTLVAAGETMLRLAQRAFAAVGAQVSAPPDLLCAMADALDAHTAVLERAEWLLDGWRPICLIWRTADDIGGRAPTVAELAACVPVLPDEAEAWFALKAGTAARINGVRKPGLVRARTVTALEQVARNEQIRVLAA